MTRPSSCSSPRPRGEFHRFLSALPALVLVLAACGKTAEPTSDGQGLVIQPYEGPLARGVEKRDPRLFFHDFGRVPNGDTVTRVFELWNTDPRAVAITRVDPGCGCTVASVRALRADGTVEQGLPITSKAPQLLTIGPGERAEVEVRIATRDLQTKNTDKLIAVRILTDSPNAYFLTLELHVLVEQPFYVVPGAIALGRIPENGGGEGKVEIVPAGGFGYLLKEVLPPGEGVHAVLTDEVRNGAPVWTLRAGFTPPLARGPLNASVRIATEESAGVPGREIEVPLTATVVADLDADPERLVFAVPRDAAARGSCELYSRLAGQRLRVLGVELPEAQRDYLSARYEPVEPDDDGTSLRWRITLETVPPLPELPMIAGALRIQLADPQYPSHALEYVLHVR